MEPNQEVPVPTSPTQAADPAPIQGEVLPNPVQPVKSKKKIIIAAIVLVVLVVAGWGAYYFVYASPGRIGQKFAGSVKMPAIVSGSYDFAYQDNGKLTGDAANNPMASIFSDVKFSVNGTAYANSSDINNPEGSMDMSYSLGSGDTSISSKMQVIIKGRDIYLNLGNNPAVNSLLALLSPDQKIEWIKINPKELQALSQMSASGTKATNLDYTQLTKAYQGIIQKYVPKLITVNKFLGRETLHNVSTLHYSNNLDKVQLKSMMHDIVDLAMSQQPALQATPEDAATAKAIAYQILDNFVDRLQISSLETWIGAGDFQVHKIKFASNAPSIISLVGASSAPGVNDPDPQKAETAVLNNITFDGQLNLEEEFYDFGKTMPVTPPADSFDVANKIKEEQQQVQQQPPFPTNCPNCGLSN